MEFRMNQILSVMVRLPEWDVMRPQDVFGPEAEIDRT
jgi:hypothetical protein